MTGAARSARPMSGSSGCAKRSGRWTWSTRAALLEEPRTGKLKRINKRKDLAAVIERLCAAAGPGADIRVEARQAVRTGWNTLHTGARNVCAD